MSNPQQTRAERKKLLIEYLGGGCPECGDFDGGVNIGCWHWLYCKEHRTKWCVGSNLVKSWRSQTKEEQQKICDQIGMGEFRMIGGDPTKDGLMVGDDRSQEEIDADYALEEVLTDDIAAVFCTKQ